MPAPVVEIGCVGEWHYLIARRGNGFEVVRQDVRFDQIEESLGLALTLKSAIRRGTAAMIRDIKKKRISQLDWLQKQRENGNKSSQCNVRN
jgi:hypothetical protein